MVYRLWYIVIIFINLHKVYITSEYHRCSVLVVYNGTDFRYLYDIRYNIYL